MVIWLVSGGTRLFWFRLNVQVVYKSGAITVENLGFFFTTSAFLHHCLAVQVSISTLLFSLTFCLEIWSRGKKALRAV